MDNGDASLYFRSTYDLNPIFVHLIERKGFAVTDGALNDS